MSGTKFISTEPHYSYTFKSYNLCNEYDYFIFKMIILCISVSLVHRTNFTQ